ncbi:GNAT family acetyltransferase [Endozoicomonas montiporae]|uniref:GNAT family acetyltransferase n=1 Tax=Endozoicomonas montiporae TaxID=1027273 RepID=A0A081N6S3_9GAMM|nr:GNAT family acetyltransferase [Endozoicomonas montiporae]
MSEKHSYRLSYRHAETSDLPDLIAMLADDKLGQLREDTSSPVNPRYQAVLKAILEDPNNELMVVEYNQRIAGMLQLTFIPYLSHTGSWRCLIESVRVHSDFRGRGLGTEFVQWSIERARERQCNLVQLTSDKQRPEALKFYRNLGFVDSHEGFKLKL